MKMPCELIVSEILPTARGELARQLVMSHGLTQAKVAKMFGVTSAAVSQYIKGLRGGNVYIENSVYRNLFYEKLASCADAMMEGSNFVDTLCEICCFAKQTGMVDEIYAMQGSKENLNKCPECPRDNFNPES